MVVWGCWVSEREVCLSAQLREDTWASLLEGPGEQEWPHPETSSY